jgi:hypothetical protein
MWHVSTWLLEMLCSSARKATRSTVLPMTFTQKQISDTDRNGTEVSGRKQLRSRFGA